MIVDDRAIARHLVRQAAALPQDTVLECASPAEALTAMGIFQPDCVLINISHPLPDAFAAIKSIRETHPATRVLAVSTFREARLQQLASDAGAAGYVTTENLSELFLLAAPERLSLPPVRRSKGPRK